ncbi:hypothetical protein MTO96_015090 [Rhipicephalus appendiculatus]
MSSTVSVLVLCLVLLTYGSRDVGNVISREYSDNGSTPLRYWIDDHDDLAIVTCSTNGGATKQQLRITEVFRKMATWWSCECSGLHALLRRNVARNVKSAVFVFAHSAQEQPNCTKIVPRSVFMNYMTQWITVRTKHNRFNLGTDVMPKQVPEVCVRTSHRPPSQEAGTMCVSLKGATLSTAVVAGPVPVVDAKGVAPFAEVGAAGVVEEKRTLAHATWGPGWVLENEDVRERPQRRRRKYETSGKEEEDEASTQIGWPTTKKTEGGVDA